MLGTGRFSYNDPRFRRHREECSDLLGYSNQNQWCIAQRGGQLPTHELKVLTQTLVNQIPLGARTEADRTHVSGGTSGLRMVLQVVIALNEVHGFVEVI